MDWYKVVDFVDRIVDIERFLVEIAAKEKYFRRAQLSWALGFASAPSAMESMERFGDDFVALLRSITRPDPQLAKDIQALDDQGRLVEQIALVLLELEMAKSRTQVAETGSLIIKAVGALLPVFRIAETGSLFEPQQISLHKLIVTLQRYRAMVKIAREVLTSRATQDDETFKPSKVDEGRVVSLIDRAIRQLELLEEQHPEQVARAKAFLIEAKVEAESSVPSWQKVVGALVIVAAITSGIADSVGAGKNIKDAIDYILGISLVKPMEAPSLNYESSPLKQDAGTPAGQPRKGSDLTGASFALSVGPNRLGASYLSSGGAG